MELTLYCKNCGKLLKREESFNGFNRITGEKNISYVYKCEDKEHDYIEENSEELKQILHEAKGEAKAKEYKIKEKRVKELIKELQTLGKVVKVTDINYQSQYD
jgi:hypothetical protein